MNKKVITQLESIIGKSQTIDEIIDSIRALILQYSDAVSKEKSIPASEFLNQGLMHDVNNPDMYFRTGFEAFDEATGGISLSELIVVGARPSMGKTQFLLRLSLTISESERVHFTTFDLPSHVLFNRILGFMTELWPEGIKRKLNTPEMQEKIAEAQKKLSNHSLFIHDARSLQIEVLIAYLKEQVATNETRIFFIDGLHKIRSFQNRKFREQEVGHVMEELKTFAREENVAIIVSSELSRSVETRGGDKRPMLSDLRESGSIEQDADKVIFLYRPAYYNITEDYDGTDLNSVMDIILAKNISGVTNTFRYKHNSLLTRFTEYLPENKTFEFNKERLNEIE